MILRRRRTYRYKSQFKFSGTLVMFVMVVKA